MPSVLRQLAGTIFALTLSKSSNCDDGVRAVSQKDDEEALKADELGDGVAQHGQRARDCPARPGFGRGGNARRGLIAGRFAAELSKEFGKPFSINRLLHKAQECVPAMQSLEKPAL